MMDEDASHLTRRERPPVMERPGQGWASVGAKAAMRPWLAG